MIELIQVNKNDLATLLMCSFRYALGRSTYVTIEVSQQLLRYKDLLSPCTKEKIVKEINEAIMFHNAGTSMDVKMWERVEEEFAHG